MKSQTENIPLIYKHIKKSSWQNWAMFFIFALAFGEMAWLSVRRAMGLNALWFDLGGMTQAIYSVLSGGLLEYSDSLLFINSSRLGGHVEIIYFFFAPLLLIFRSPVTLLVAQAFFYATGGIAFYLIGIKLKNKTLGIWLAIFYLWYPISQSAVLFDFHGDTIAMPLLAWALYAFTVRAWKPYYLLIILALLCKVYVALPVMLLGLILYKKGFQKQGFITSFLAGTWGAFAFFIIRNWFSPYDLSPVQSYFFFRILPEAETFLNPIRILTVLIIIVPIIPYLKRASLWLIPALGVVLSALFFPGYAYYFHHYAIAVPFIIYFLGKEFCNKKNKGPERNGIASLMLASSLVLNLIFIFLWGPGEFISNSAPTNGPERAEILIPWINEIVPEDAPITSSPHLSPFLAMRPVIYQTFRMHRNLDEPVNLEAAGKLSEYFVVDAFFERDRIAILPIEEDVLQWITQPNSEFTLEAARDGVFIFSKKTPPRHDWKDSGKTYSISLEPVSTGNGISMIKVESETIFSEDQWKFRFNYQWQRDSQNKLPRWYATSNLVGYPSSRAFHLESWVLSPTSKWAEKEIIQELVILNLPHTPGCFPVIVGWYDPLINSVAAEEIALQGDSVIWGYWRMEEELGEGDFVDSCGHE